MDSTNIAAVVVVPFGVKNPDGIVLALNELCQLGIKRVLLVYDKHWTGEKHALAAAETVKNQFETEEARVELLMVEEDDTTPRWRRGILKAFENQTVDAVFVFACDFDLESPPTDKTRKGWRTMVEQAKKNALVPGDYHPKPEAFKGQFKALVGMPAVEAVFPCEAPKIIEAGLDMLRTEYFIVGRAVLEQVRRDWIIWTLDPTIDLILACIRSPDLELRVVDLQEFSDPALERDPLGQLFQMTRFVWQLVINRIRLERSLKRGGTAQIAAYDALRACIERAYQVLIQGVDRNHPAPAELSKSDYEKWRVKLLALSGVADPEVLNQLLPGRFKYDPETLQALPFEGISVIHSIDGRTASGVGFARVVGDLKQHFKDAGNLGRKIALVKTDSVHATIFDLINEPEHGAALQKNRYDYLRVRKEVEKTAVEWLREINVSLRATAHIIRVGMFAPAVLKLDLLLHPSVVEVFQGFRSALHKRLSKVPGYSCARPPEWNKPLNAHLTVGYVVHPLDENEIEALLEILDSYNKAFVAVPLDLTQGVVTKFSDMDSYQGV